jgi:hypothetical protein
MVSVIIPAHNEAGVIGRLLGHLACSAATAAHMDVIVVANGCTDDTAEVAAKFGPPVRVVTLPVASKREALDAGDRLAHGFPRIYVDADIELTVQDIEALAAVLRRPGVLAAAPERSLAMAGRPWVVRWYYDVWTRLPEVRSGLFGRGVVGVSELGHERVASLPPVMADDLAASLVFQPAERVVVPEAKAVIQPPRTVADLLRRRVRAAVSVTQIERTAGTPDTSARTSLSDLSAMTHEDLRMAPRVLVFLVVAVLARLRARRALRSGGYSTWLRDESSRQA